MIENMTHVMIFVKDYDEALEFYTNKLGFVKIADVSLAPGFRFLSVAPAGKGTEIILHVPNVEMQEKAEAIREVGLIGKTPSLMFKVDDCKKTCDELRSKGVTIMQEPEEAPFGIQARIADLYGNPLWLIEHPK
ncbi:VOC family protein [Methanosarcina hadiensis]|uniref:VOC family protein n=1 Tax=Methanosarcina hadiensis TaxID=3078083 RepID=UPI003977DA23